jgi:methionyl-tRNA synthetase
MRLAAEVNRYLDSSAPWFEIKTDRAAAAQSVYTGLKAIDSLKILLAPFLPFSSEKLHAYLGYDGSIFGEAYTETRQDALGAHTVLRYRPPRAGGRWQPSDLAPGTPLRSPSPLFKKLEEKVAEEERIKLGK